MSVMAWFRQLTIRNWKHLRVKSTLDSNAASEGTCRFAIHLVRRTCRSRRFGNSRLALSMDVSSLAQTMGRDRTPHRRVLFVLVSGLARS